MIRTSLIALALAACNASQADGPARNLVCERVSLLSPDSKCQPAPDTKQGKRADPTAVLGQPGTWS